jgi:hypothetical protein
VSRDALRRQQAFQVVSGMKSLEHRESGGGADFGLVGCSLFSCQMACITERAISSANDGPKDNCGASGRLG